MISARGIIAAALTVALGLAVGACREDELMRPLSYDKGHYQGDTGKPLNEATLHNLRQRQKRQGFSGL